jgi:hypothetical protein
VKRERFDRKRGRHKKRASRETREWELEHLPPAAPPWMPPETTRQLLTLRRELDLLG